MTVSKKLLFFAGSARAGSYNKKLARIGVRIAEASGIAVTFLDLGDFPMPIYNGDLEASEGPPENARKLKAQMLAHAGVFIAAPEYNASITPLLKNAIDWVSHAPSAEGEPIHHAFRGRVFALGSASPGGMGGLRGLVTLRTVLELGLGALVLPDQFAVPRAHQAFDGEGYLSNKESQAQLETLIQKLARTARVLHG